jgi:hypothetical protein
VTTPTGKQYAIEVKTGKSPYTPAQRAKDEAMAKQGAQPTGANAAKAGLNGPVQLDTKVVRYK